MKKILTILILALLCLPLAAEAAPVPAKSAYKFTDSVGVNVHASYTNTAYGPRWETMSTMLQQAGIKHARDLAFGPNDESYAKLDSLAAKGIKTQLIFDQPRTGMTLTEFVQGALARCGAACEGIEGPNENEGWSPARMRAFQTEMYRAAKIARPQMRVGAPAMRGVKFYADYGDYSDISDWGNMHPYPGGRDPESAQGVGLNRWIAGARFQSPTEPLWATETGYHNDLQVANHAGVPEDVQAVYTPRVPLFYFLSGVERTYFYEALDQNASSDMQRSFGLINHDGAPKPAYTALKNLMNLLSDPNGSGFQPGSLDYTITGDTTNLRQVLLQKSNGKFYLALWQDAPVYDISTRTRIAVPNKSVTIRFAQRVSQIRVFEPNRQATQVSAYSGPLQISQGITPTVKIYEITR